MISQDIAASNAQTKKELSHQKEVLMTQLNSLDTKISSIKVKESTPYMTYLMVLVSLGMIATASKKVIEYKQAGSEKIQDSEDLYARFIEQELIWWSEF